MNVRVRPLMVLALLLAGCLPDSHVPMVVSPVPGDTASASIATDGGSLTLEGFTLAVPAGALAAETELTVMVTEATVPGTFNAFSPLYELGPAGTTFAEPVTVELPFDGDPETATVFWTTAAGDAFVPLPTRIEGNLAIVEATHFSRAFVGTACSGDDCCGRANGDLDVLLMVDNSNSMTEEQAALASQIARMAEVLATGDLDGDGVQDFPALRSVRVGTVSSDMGTGGYIIPTCDRPDFGDDGVLASDASGAPGCAASYASYAELNADDPLADTAAFVSHVSCVATRGVGGCGFEQQLEAVLKAVTPSSAGPMFHGDTTGHADGANAGFLRDDSVLATILLTDEDDCSTLDPELFNPSSSIYSADLNLRCMTYPEAVQPTDRYVAGLQGLREDPNDVIFAVIAGVPVDLVSDPSSVDHAAILADPRMANEPDPERPEVLAPSCELAGRGLAYPARRLVETAAGFGDNGVVQSICQEDFTPVIDAILTRVAARVSGSCG